MWCHLCSQDYPDFEDFRIHIMENHRNASKFCEDDSDMESLHENDEISVIDLENDALNTPEENYCESDHDIDTEIKSDTKMDRNDKKGVLNIFPGQYRNVSTEIKSDDSVDADNMVSGEYCNLDPTIDIKSDSNLSNSALNNLPEKSHDDEAETSFAKGTMSKKLRQRCSKENKSSIKKSKKIKLPKLKTPSILKKRERKKQIKVSFGKKLLLKHKRSTCSHQDDIPENSDDHSESSLNDDNKVNPQPVCNNFINPVPTIPVNNYPPTITNNPVYIVNPYGGQAMNNYVLGNQAVPPFYVINPVAAKPVTSNTPKGFVFNSENIIKWLTKHKELCKNIEYPLPTSLFNQVKAVHNGIFDHYCAASISEETSAVLKVYEELDCMIHKHINSINNPFTIS